MWQMPLQTQGHHLKEAIRQLRQPMAHKPALTKLIQIKQPRHQIRPKLQTVINLPQIQMRLRLQQAMLMRQL
jgi:hypothetical protein